MALQEDTSIMDLDELVQSLPYADRALFERIFQVNVTYGRIVPPESMHPWIVRQFGSLEQTLEQKIVRVTNLITLEGALFNWLRSHRPLWRRRGPDLEEELQRMTDDPLDNPYAETPEDVFGRVEGQYCVTAANVAKFDGMHAVLVFKERHPLRFTREQIHDYIDTGWRWALRAHEEDATARYYLFLWNCLWRAGASLVHGHAQLLLGRYLHYAQVEALRRAALLYQAHNRTNYFEDLYRVHRCVGAGFEKDGVKVLAELTPIKENEVMLMAPALTDSLKDCIYDVLSCYRDRLGVQSFNVVIYMPPLADTLENWAGFPVVVRMVDRGDLSVRTADFGAMELYAASVVSADPLKLAQVLQEHMGV